jgi:hypothetical protein
MILKAGSIWPKPAILLLREVKGTYTTDYSTALSGPLSMQLRAVAVLPDMRTHLQPQADLLAKLFHLLLTWASI